MLWIQFANIKDGRMKEFQEWTKKNEKLIEKHAPPGWSYRGTFGTVLGFGRYDTATIFECSKYADFDTFREYRDETWERLAEEAQDFFLPGPGWRRSGEAILLREIGDMRVTERKKPKK